MALSCAVAVASAGCHARLARAIVHPAPPIGPIDGVVTASPIASGIWVVGHYEWVGHHYVWMEGRWIPARPGYVYVQPHWEEVVGGWVFVPGVWVIRF